MKKALTAVALLAGAVTGFSQGQISMFDYGGSFAIQVFTQDASGAIPVSWGGFSGTEQQGNTINNDNPGTTTYTGTPLGAGYTVELLAGAAGSPLASLTEVAGSSVSAWNSGGGAGYWNAPTLLASIPGITTTAQVAIAAWNNEGGTITSLAAAQAAGDPWGISATATTAALGYNTVTPPYLPAGVTSFSLATTVPEPSTIALGVIGASAFLMRLRRKQ